MNNDPKISPGETGCTLSHLKTIMKCLKSGAEYSLICEDDIEFLSLFASDNSLEKVMKNAPKDWDYINIYYDCNEYHEGKKYLPYYRKDGRCWGAVAYIINKKGCQKIAKKCFKNNMFILDIDYLKDARTYVGGICVADTYIQFFLNAYVYHYSLVTTQNNSDGMGSTIHDSHTPTHNKRSIGILRNYYNNLIQNYDFSIPRILIITGELSKETKSELISLYNNFQVIFSSDKDKIRRMMNHGGLCVDYNQLKNINPEYLIKLSNDSLNIFYIDKKLVAISSIPNHPILNYIHLNNKKIPYYIKSIPEDINVINLDDSLSF